MLQRLVLVALLSAALPAASEMPDRKAVDSVVDAWHKAASDANEKAYFSLFTKDAVFLGTDATERWTRDEFQKWAKPFFARGKAWSFTATKRWVSFSSDGKTAWFDEQLDTPNMGPCRGSGVLVLEKEGWRIAQYNLSIPIPNGIVDEVVKKIGERPLPKPTPH
jgi:ketosteroid isomerase-like protein